MATPRILVTNDDGIDSPGLHAVVLAVLAPIGSIMVVAPDRNRSAVSRSITLAQTLSVTEEEVPGADIALATDGTPTDCVRLAALGLAGGIADIVVSGANQGLNVGDDVTYSGTVAAAFEANSSTAFLLSRSANKRPEADWDIRARESTTGAPCKRFLLLLTELMLARGSEISSKLLNVNVPGLPPEAVEGVEIGRLGRRIYRDKLTLHETRDGKRHFSLYGDDPSHHEELGTDIAAISCWGHISVTPLRFQLDDDLAQEALSHWDLPGLLL